jgi:threonine dehydrogenase-like Zn-dependent dehydrogenase
LKGLIWLGEDALTADELAEPIAGPGEVVVEVLRAGICGSDLHAYRGRAGGRQPPLVLGHEAVGMVDGSHESFAVFPLSGCGICGLCRGGSENLCPQRNLLGLDRPGTLAERVAVPSNCLIPLPEGLSVNDAVLAEPLATSVSVLAASSSAANVVVVGCGAIGLLALHAAMHDATGTQVSVEVADPVAARRRAAVELGAARAYPSVNGLRAAAADLVIDAVGTEETWTGAVRAVRPGGTVAIIGLGQTMGSVPMGYVVRSGITLHGSYAYSRRDFEQALALLAARPLSREIVTTAALDEGPAAFRLLTEQPERAVKMVLCPARDTG